MSSGDTKDDEPKSARFNMFVSPSELNAIDEWAWKNRVRSKSEAVRRLCQIGLLADRHMDDILSSAEHLDRGTELLSRMVDMVAERNAAYTVEDVQDFVRDMRSASEEMMGHTLALWNGLVPFGKVAGFAKAAESSERNVAEVLNVLQEIYARRGEARDLYDLLRVMDEWSAEKRAEYDALGNDERESFAIEEIRKYRESRPTANRDVTR